MPQAVSPWVLSLSSNRLEEAIVDNKIVWMGDEEIENVRVRCGARSNIPFWDAPSVSADRVLRKERYDVPSDVLHLRLRIVSVAGTREIGG